MSGGGLKASISKWLVLVRQATGSAWWLGVVAVFSLIAFAIPWLAAAPVACLQIVLKHGWVGPIKILSWKVIETFLSGCVLLIFMRYQGVRFSAIGCRWPDLRIIIPGAIIAAWSTRVLDVIVSFMMNFGNSTPIRFEETTPLWVSILSTGLLTPLSEEFLFRGFLLRFIQSRSRAFTAVMLSSFIFAVLHRDHSLWIHHFVTGILYSIFVLGTGNIFVSVLAHSLHNISAMTHQGLAIWALLAGGCLIFLPSKSGTHRD